MPSPNKVHVLKRWLNLARKQALIHEDDSKESRPENRKVKALMPELNEISEILDGRLYLSGGRVATAERLASMNIKAVVRAITEHEEEILMESTKEAIRLPANIDVMYVRLMDLEDSDIQSHFDRVLRFIHTHLKNGDKVLIHCGAGISRSATLIMAYLISHKHLTLRAAYALVRNKRKIVRPNNGFFRQLIDYERETRQDGRASVRMVLTANGSSMPDIIYENAIMAKLR